MSTVENGTEVQFRGMRGKVIATSKRYVVIDFETSMDKPISIEIDDFYKRLHKDILLVESKKPTLNSTGRLSEIQKLEINRKRKYVAQLLSLGASTGGLKKRQQAIDQVVLQLKDCCPPSPATLARWAKAEKQCLDGVARTYLEPAAPYRRTKHEAVKGIALEVITDIYLQLNRPTMKSTYAVFCSKVEKSLGEAYPTPSLSTFSNWIKDICPIDMADKREGRLSKNTLSRNARNQYSVTRPLERVECDGLNLAVGIVDHEKNYIGKPTLFIVLDTYTRAVLGYSLDIAHRTSESASAVIQSYRHAVSPKLSASKAPYKNEWPMQGRFESLFADGGSGYKSSEASVFLCAIGSAHTTVQTREGWRKPFVERFNGTVRAQFAKLLPGYCGHNERSIDLDPKFHARMTKTEFIELFETWVVDDYHQTTLRGLNGKTPHEKWNDALAANLFVPLALCEQTQFKLKQSYGEIEERKILGESCHLGVAIDNARYNDNGRLKGIGLQMKQKNVTSKVKCFVDELDVSKISVEDPFLGDRFDVPVVEPAITPGMTRHEWRLLRDRNNLNCKTTKISKVGTFLNSETMKAIKQRPIKTKSRKQVITSASKLSHATQSLLAGSEITEENAWEQTNFNQKLQSASDFDEEDTFEYN
ncbi:transposase [Alginatibacterium sediminis]|uniref:Transposase n=1 Tax=Alginatibacterium sediminis TaxID=2164068 RepID=A0A420ENJ9_9ALTE|nr:DDE-type integrase/transposase/recombinase [Alginatibacterium sediminis]RKF22282.1 transposase [Alginatibacterium sediminis]